MKGLLFVAESPRRLARLRIVIGGFATVYVAVRAAHLAGVARFPPSAFDPVGPVTLLPRPLLPAVVWTLVVATALAGVAFTAGWRYRVTAPLFAAGLLWVTSYRSSWGMVFHTENLMVLHVIALALSPAADDRAVAPRAPPRDPGLYGAAVRILAVLTVLTYVIAGVSKLRLAGAAWLGGEVLETQIAFDNLRKVEAGSIHSPLVALVLPHRWIFPGLAVMTMAVELGAPLALLGRRPALIWSAAAWAFHLGVVALMAIVFPYPLLGAAYAPLLLRPTPAVPPTGAGSS